MALGYTQWRPALHPRILDLAAKWLTAGENALDIGCGAGLSTAPLRRFARRTVGIEPAHQMLRQSHRVAPGAYFATGQAERLPIDSACMDVVSAAGSLNFAELHPALAEIRRVLRVGGQLLIYDFSQGAEFRDSPALATWHAEFKRRYPSPPAQAIDPHSLPLAAHRLAMSHYEPFTLALSLTPEFYLEYALTETNVAAAIAAGETPGAIRTWCRESLDDVFCGLPRDVLFQGYFALCTT
jgi:ubiquinone/menaquinone biosynthesis C-methylase UbiE